MVEFKPNFVVSGPMLVDIGQSRVRRGRIRAKFGRDAADLGRVRADFGRTQVNFGRYRRCLTPRSQSWASSGAGGTEFVRSDPVEFRRFANCHILRPELRAQRENRVRCRPMAMSPLKASKPVKFGPARPNYTVVSLFDVC